MKSTGIEGLLPESLHDEYLNDEIVNVVFQSAAHHGIDREQALVTCIRELVRYKAIVLKRLKDQMFLQQPVITYKDK